MANLEVEDSYAPDPAVLMSVRNRSLILPHSPRRAVAVSDDKESDPS